MNKMTKVRLLLLTALLLALVGISAVASPTQAAGPNATVKVAIWNNNWLAVTYCTSAYLRGNGQVYRGTYTNWWIPYGCTVTYNNIPTNVTYRFEINGYVDRASNRNFTVLFDRTVKQPSSGTLVDMGTIHFYK